MWSSLVTFSSCAKFLVSIVFRGWKGDGREKALLKYVLENAEKDDPDSVVQTIDKFAQSGTWLMNIGQAKGKILDEELAKKNPLVLLELGTYCGYSAVRMASQLKTPGSKLISLELMPDTAEVARRVIAHAGLSDKVEVLLAPLNNQVDQLKVMLKDMDRQFFDFVFIDHDKNFYLEDYLLLKDSNLIGEGSIVFADNMGFPGSPKFWKYLQDHPQELETVYHKSTVEYMGWLGDTVTISTFHNNANYSM